MKPRILIVDDESNMRMLLKELLSFYNYEVVGEAVNGNKAVEQYSTLKPDLSIIDIMLPGISGYVVLQRILSMNLKAKVIMLTGLRQKPQVQACMKAGACDFIVKPFDNKRLIESVKRVLES